MPRTRIRQGYNLDQRLDYYALEEFRKEQESGSPLARLRSLENFHAIVDQLPDDERNIILIFMRCDEKRAPETVAAQCAGMPRSTYQYRIQRALQHVEEAATLVYGNGRKPPKGYREVVAQAIELSEQPTPEELERESVVRTFGELRSVRGTAKALGMSKSTVHRLLKEAS